VSSHFLLVGVNIFVGTAKLLKMKDNSEMISKILAVPYHKYLDESSFLSSIIPGVPEGCRHDNKYVYAFCMGLVFR